MANGNLPILTEGVTCLHIDTPAGVDVLRYLSVAILHNRIIAQATHKIGIECKALILEYDIGKPRLQRPATIVDKEAAFLSLHATRSVIITVCSRYGKLRCTLSVEIALAYLASRLEFAQRIQLYTCRIGKSTLLRYGEIASVAGGD